MIDKNGINIEYMYGLSIESEKAYIVLKASNLALVDKLLTEAGVQTISEEMLTEL